MIVHIFVTEGVTDRGVTEGEWSQRGGHRGGVTEGEKSQRGRGLKGPKGGHRGGNNK